MNLKGRKEEYMGRFWREEGKGRNFMIIVSKNNRKVGLFVCLKKLITKNIMQYATHSGRGVCGGPRHQIP